jgi:hypothetical protein
MIGLMGWSKRNIATGFLTLSMLFVGACSSISSTSGDDESATSGGTEKVIRIAIGMENMKGFATISNGLVTPLGHLLPTKCWPIRLILASWVIFHR